MKTIVYNTKTGFKCFCILLLSMVPVFLSGQSVKRQSITCISVSWNTSICALQTAGQPYETNFNSDYTNFVFQGFQQPIADIQTNTKKTNEPELYLYPNPATDHFILYNRWPEQASLVEIFDISGSPVFIKQLSEEPDINISCNKLEKGIYLVQVKTNTGQSYATTLLINK